MPKGYRDYQESLKQSLVDPYEAAQYLSVCLEGGSREVFLLALRQVAAAHGMTRLAGKTEVGRESLYRALSAKGNPRLDTLIRLLNAAGLQLAVEPKKRKRRAA
jgi:probable addiction module antidote protein